MSDDEKREVLEFLNQNPMGVISTIDSASGSPESALVAFAETQEFELIFQTMDFARKYQNLKKDGRVSFVTGWEIEKERQITFQYEGIARELEPDTVEYRTYRSIFEAKETPCTSEFLDNSRSRIFAAKPMWLRFSDYSQIKPRVVEVGFN